MTQQTIPRVGIEEIRDANDILIGQSQETQIYYRPAKDKDGNTIWIPTTPLPADAWHMNYYAKKGFKLWPLEEGVGAELTKLQSSPLACRLCPFEAKTYIGLARHMRMKHDTK